MNVFGLFEVERKTDFLALTAFLISILTLGYQIGIYFVGPSPRLVQPDGLTIMRFEPRSGNSYISILAPVSIANTSNSPQPLLVRRYTAKLSFADREFNWEWHRRVMSTRPGDQKLDLIDDISVAPFIVDTKNIDSNLFLFTPHNRPCKEGLSTEACNVRNGFVGLSEFNKIAVSMLRKRKNNVEVVFSAQLGDDAPETQVTCNFEFTDYALIRLRNNGYAQVLCK